MRMGRAELGCLLVAFFFTAGIAFADYPVATFPLDTGSSGGSQPATSVQLTVRFGANLPNTNYCMPPYPSWCVIAIDQTLYPTDVGKSFKVDSSSPNFPAIAAALSSTYGFALSSATLNGAGGRASDVPLRGEVSSLVFTFDHFCSSPPAGCAFSDGKYYDTVLLMHLTVMAPQVTSAIGQVGAGDTWTTGFLVVNTGTTDAQYSISFFDDGGHALALPFNAGPMKTVTGVIPGSGSSYFEASDPGAPLVIGWGLVTADPTLVVQSTLRSHSSGTYYEAAVPMRAGRSEIVVPFNATTFSATGEPFYTGVAIANMDQQATAYINCTVRDSLGNVIPNGITVPQTLPPLGHWSNYLFPLLTGKRGTIDCQSYPKIAATAFQFIGTTAFSSVPVIEK